jgi:hypothetical protein
LFSGSSSNNIAIGFAAGPSTLTDESNKLYIASGSGTPLIKGDFAAKTVNISGSLIATSFTGSLLGTASFATQSTSASFATTASFYGGSVTSASYAATASNIQGGDTNYIPIWNTATSLSSSIIYQSTGNVGIGTTSPSYKLHIESGDVLVGQSVAKVSVGPQGTTGDVHFGASGLAAPSTGSQDYGFYAAHNAYRTSTGAWVHSRTSTIPAVRILGSGGVSSGNSGFSFDYSANSGTGNIAWTNLMQIQTNGNVGIGTTSPGYKLDIAGDIRLNTNATYIYNRTTGGGNVRMLGINVSNIAYIGPIDSGPIAAIFNASSTSLFAAFYTSGAERMRITSAGNVGIGTATPTAKLHVVGSTLITGSLTVTGSVIATTGFTGSLQGTASFATSASYAQTASYVENAQTASFVTGSIFTSANPALSASYAQTASFVQNAQTASFVLNAISSSFATTASYANMALSASYAPDTTFPYTGSALITGSLGVTGSINGLFFSRGGGNVSTNISIGRTTNFSSSATGGDNFAAGNDALCKNTTGEANTAIGFSALNCNTTGANNTAIGLRALLYNTTGVNNTAIGRYALFYNTTGTYNTAIGYRALYSNTTGAYNAAIGSSALQANTTGASNTAIGPSALSSNTTGYFNTAIGNSALRANTTGTNNTAIGYNALRYNTSGSNNIAFGQNAGKFLSGSSSNNIAIGFGSGPSTLTEESNKLYIASGSGTPLIKGDFAAKTVNISGSLIATSFTGSLLGTASFATQSTSASFATTASFYGGSVTSASYAATASNIQGVIQIIFQFGIQQLLYQVV